MGKPIMDYVRGVCLMTVFVFASCLVTLLQLCVWPICALFDKQYAVTHWLTVTAAKLVGRLFFRVRVCGIENLPSKEVAPAAIMVCNHQSTLDTMIAAELNWVHFKVTFKRELLYMPGLGSAMWLAGYLSVKRGDRSSGQALLARAAEYLRNNVWVFFFPEGTRKIDGSSGPLGDFKPGAFKLAIDNNVPIVPLTISGARAMMPAKGFPTLTAGGEAVLTVHPLISSTGKTVEQLSEEVRRAIVSGLRPIDDLPPSRPKTAAATPVSGDASGDKKRD